MTKYVEVELSNGQTVKVHPVPPYVIDAIAARFPEPQVPKRQVDPEVALVPGDMVDDDQNPEYLKARNEWMMARGRAYVDARLIYGLKDERPPENWPTDDDKELWKFLEIEVEIPADRMGRQLAYIKYGLLMSGQDMELVNTAIDSFSTELTKEEVDQLIASFRHQSQRHPD